MNKPETGLKRRLIKQVRASWISAALVTAVLLLFSSSVVDAQWVPDSSTFINCLVLGAICGWLLSISRFSSQGKFNRGKVNGENHTDLGAAPTRLWLAAFYSLVMSLAAASQAVGIVVMPFTFMASIVQTAGAKGWLDVLWLLNVRLLTFFDRAAGWISVYNAGDKVQDIGLFVFLIGLIAWNAAAWLVWCVVRQKRALDGMLPLGFLMALNVYLSDQNMNSLLTFAGCAVLLAGRTSFTRLQAGWEKRRIDYPWELGLDWSLMTLGLATAVVMLALVVPYFTNPKSWQQINETLLNWQRKTEKTAGQLFPNVNPPRAKAPAPQAQTPSLNVIGAPVSTGQSTVMYVRISDPPPPPDTHSASQPAKLHYWRSLIYGVYTGTGWLAAPLLDQIPGGADPVALDGAAQTAGRYELKQTYEILAEHSTDLFSVGEPQQSDAGAVMRFTAPDYSRLLKGTVSNYTVTSWAADPTVAQMQAAPTTYPADIAASYLQIPDELPRRVRDLAQRLAGSAATPYEIAVRIQDYLRMTYPYNLNTPPPPRGRDAVDYFLFEAPGGFCTYYASAMAMMLRVNGVPARVATGYAMGDYDITKNAFRVPLSASHAWTEVYFPGLGWVEFEPTSALSTFTRPEGGAAPLPTWDPAIQANMQKAATRQRSVLLLLGLGAGVGLLVLLMFLSARGLFESRGGTPSSRQAQALYRRMRLVLGWAGLRAPPSATPDEFLAVCADSLAQRGALLFAVQQVTAIYRQAAFSQRPPSADAIYAANRAWESALPEWVGLVGRKLISRKGGGSL